MKNPEMKSAMSIRIGTLLLVCMGGAFAADAPTTPANTYDQYSVIYERNIFSRDRLPPQTEQSPRRVRTTQVLAIYVLRGVAVERDEKVAFIEEQISGQTTLARVGTEVLNGRIKDIRFNRVTFEENEQEKQVRVGEEFGKSETTVVTTATESTEEAETTAAAPAAAEQPDAGGAPGDESDILKRLMERRQSELGQ